MIEVACCFDLAFFNCFNRFSCRLVMQTGCWRSKSGTPQICGIFFRRFSIPVPNFALISTVLPKIGGSLVVSKRTRKSDLFNIVRIFPSASLRACPELVEGTSLPVFGGPVMAKIWTRMGR